MQTSWLRIIPSRLFPTAEFPHGIWIIFTYSNLATLLLIMLASICGSIEKIAPIAILFEWLCSKKMTAVNRRAFFLSIPLEELGSNIFLCHFHWNFRLWYQCQTKDPCYLHSLQSKRCSVSQVEDSRSEATYIVYSSTKIQEKLGCVELIAMPNEPRCGLSWATLCRAMLQRDAR